MLFITNRAIRQSERSRRNRNIDFDLAATGSTSSVFYCERAGVGDYTEVMSPNLTTRIAESACREIVLFIHGYNVLPEGHDDNGQDGAFATARALQELLDGVDHGRYFVLPLIWPTDDDPGMLKDYFDDRLTAQASGSAFARVIGKFLKWRSEQGDAAGCFKRINVLSHSMGAMLSLSTITNWASLHGSAPRIFRHMFMFAPDVPNEVLHRSHPGRSLADSASTVSVYHAADDLAMQASKVVNLTRVVSRRLGHTGPEDMGQVPSNVFAIDCGDFNTRYDPLQGHSYFLRDGDGDPGAAFRHMAQTLLNSRPHRGGGVELSSSHENSLFLPKTYALT